MCNPSHIGDADTGGRIPPPQSPDGFYRPQSREKSEIHSGDLSGSSDVDEAVGGAWLNRVEVLCLCCWLRLCITYMIFAILLERASGTGCPGVGLSRRLFGFPPPLTRELGRFEPLLNQCPLGSSKRFKQVWGLLAKSPSTLNHRSHICMCKPLIFSHLFL